MKQKPYLLVSRCLLGEACRYDGKSVPVKEVMALSAYATLISICPESDGGMSTPRIPSERQGEKVVNQAGEDTTAFFQRGADLACLVAKEKQIPFAVLKEKSPSCGTKQIYDGSFTGAKIPGEGMTAEALRKAGVTLFSEEDFREGIPAPLKEYLGI